MNKKIFLLLTLVLLAGCGFQPVLKNYDMSKINIQKINYSAKNDLAYQVKNNLNIKETNDAKGLTINISISESRSPITKNAAGIVIEEDLLITINLDVLDNKAKNLLSDSFIASKKLKVTDNLSLDEEIRRIEKNNLISNLSQKIKFKLQIIAKQSQ
jgi:outer membrane lipopolysaccharide assembly protein LptE/RlpB|tara:strand:- start:310 stop:780 length:471 start_codon:yes stop_codon:yes gene_type:complete